MLLFKRTVSASGGLFKTGSTKLDNFIAAWKFSAVLGSNSGKNYISGFINKTI